MLIIYVNFVTSSTRTLLDKLEALLPDEHKSIVDALEATHKVNKAVSGKFLDENWKKLWMTLKKKSCSFMHFVVARSGIDIER